MSRQYPIYKLTCPETGRTVYCEWVSACDAPGQAFLTEAAVIAHWETEARDALDRANFNGGPEQIAEAAFEYAHEKARNLRRLARLRDRGHTLLDRPAYANLAEHNRAGANESQLTLPELVASLIEGATR